MRTHPAPAPGAHLTSMPLSRATSTCSTVSAAISISTGAAAPGGGPAARYASLLIRLLGLSQSAGGCRADGDACVPLDALWDLAHSELSGLTAAARAAAAREGRPRALDCEVSQAERQLAGLRADASDCLLDGATRAAVQQQLGSAIAAIHRGAYSEGALAAPAAAPAAAADAASPAEPEPEAASPSSAGSSSDCGTGRDGGDGGGAGLSPSSGTSFGGACGGGGSLAGGRRSPVEAEAEDDGAGGCDGDVEADADADADPDADYGPHCARLFSPSPAPPASSRQASLGFTEPSVGGGGLGPSPRVTGNVFVASATLPPTPPGAGKKAAAAAAAVSLGAPSPTAKRTGWGRSVLPQESGLWNASPFHPASPASPTGPRSGRGTPRGSSCSAASVSAACAAAPPPPALAAPAPAPPPARSASGRLQPARAPGGAAGGRAPGGGAGGYSVVCVPASSTGGGKALQMRLDPDTAAALAALYRTPQKLDSADTLGYTVRAAPAPAAAAAPEEHAHGCGGAPLLGEHPRFAAAREAFLRGGASSGGSNWVARLTSAARTGSACDVDGAVGRLQAAFARNGLPLRFDRLGPCTYGVCGKRLNVRQVNGQLLVRMGGGYDDVTTALARLPWTALAAEAGARGGAAATAAW
ncbi:hypothetical protein Rsub_03184 [Raphidocelis subcapitata]|uniref:Uncharacterized protein n=1 Tax=Raphidocelis subcapitata TaxID=307507 RepID=A0A2V0NVA7_9CHLO|nr:hypothetical protein Rsub_03184 [Raphidocelis subcapitata]|eukprot:GBF90612.1 hypothetical protein Rsub_03184 [Raphidocelis subcapitata]